MIDYMLSKRTWHKKFSWLKRTCYVSGESLWFRNAYRGNKKIWSIINNGQTLEDNIWLSVYSYRKHIGGERFRLQ